MKSLQSNRLGVLELFTFLSIIIFTSTTSLAEIAQTKELHIQKGYPYAGLVDRSEEVTILYSKGKNKVNCRVEVSQKGQLWRGEEHSTSLKKFSQKPLRACLDRRDAKKLLADTF